jgi:hypothetical protein
MKKFSTIIGNKFGRVNRSCPVHKKNEMIRLQCKKHGGQDHVYCCNKYNPFHRDPVPCIPDCEETCTEESFPVIFEEICADSIEDTCAEETEDSCAKNADSIESAGVDEDACKLEDIYALPEESFVVEKKDITVVKQGMITLQYKNLIRNPVYKW